MNQAVKWGDIAAACLLILVLAGLLIIPKFVNVQKYKPQIEQRIAAATGRTFSIGDDLRLSLFPWAGMAFSELSLGNPSGFSEKQFITVKSFEVRVKLIPLLFKDIQVKRFLLNGARIVLEKNKDGRVSWDFAKKAPGKVPSEIHAKENKGSAEKTAQKPLLKSLAIGEFAITGGAVLWIDHAKGMRKELNDVNIRFQDVSLKRPVKLTCSALVDGKPLVLEGSIGPLGEDPGKGTIPVDVKIKALQQLETRLQGQVVNPAGSLRYDLHVQVASFSPRKLLATLNQKFPVITADPQALNHVALKAKITGDTQQVSVSEGALDVDQSKIKMSVTAKAFEKPDLTFEIQLDEIDADRYLPPKNKAEPSDVQEASKVEKGGGGISSAKKPVDYAPLRRLVLSGSARIGKLKIKNARMENVYLKIEAKNGVFNLDPFSMAMYQGVVSGNGSLNVQTSVPRTQITLSGKEIQANPLLKDILKKDVLAGTLKAQMDVVMSGDTAESVKKSLGGKGDLLFKDGAVKGIDLAGMVRNIKATFGLAENVAERPKTDFAELHVPFTIQHGRINTPQTSLASPLLRIKATGNADLPTESLAFRIEPKFVGTLKGQGDNEERSGITVPILVSGSFNSPKFRPDLEGMFKKEIENKLPDLQKRIFGGDEKKDTSTSLQEQIKGLFKGLPSGK